MEKFIQIVLLTLLCCQTIICDEVSADTRFASAANVSRQLVDKINDFGYKLLVNLMNNNDAKNIAISPTSIAGVLIMALLGSVGKTYDELTTMFGFSQDVLENRRNHEAVGRLLSELSNSNKSSVTSYANAVVVDALTPLRAHYRDYLMRVYHGDALTVDFKHDDTSRTFINQWVSNHTSMAIQNLLKDPVPQQTRLVLLSALYFNGQWLHPFNEQYTQKLPFHKVSGEILVDQMLNMGKFDYVYSNNLGLQMLALPYTDHTATMYVIKPYKNKSIKQIVNELNNEIINELIDQMSNTSAVVRIPKMEIENNINLEDSLKALGLQRLFKPYEANFALMVENLSSNQENTCCTESNSSQTDHANWKSIVSSLPNPGIHVDSVLHDIKININEYGTVAVAATAGVLARTAELFYVDSPFYFFIRDEKTKLVTFSAIIYDPTA